MSVGASTEEVVSWLADYSSNVSDLQKEYNETRQHPTSSSLLCLDICVGQYVQEKCAFKSL